MTSFEGLELLAREWPIDDQWCLQWAVFDSNRINEWGTRTTGFSTPLLPDGKSIDIRTFSTRYAHAKYPDEADTALREELACRLIADYRLALVGPPEPGFPCVRCWPVL